MNRLGTSEAVGKGVSEEGAVDNLIERVAKFPDGGEVVLLALGVGDGELVADDD